MAVDGEGLGGGREGRLLCRSLWSRLRLFAVVDGCLPLFGEPPVWRDPTESEWIRAGGDGLRVRTLALHGGDPSWRGWAASGDTRAPRGAGDWRRFGGLIQVNPGESRLERWAASGDTRAPRGDPSWRGGPASEDTRAPRGAGDWRWFGGLIQVNPGGSRLERWSASEDTRAPWGRSKLEGMGCEWGHSRSTGRW